jgi:hypothetical protein
MPQGFKNSPVIFQRAMNIVLDGLINKICIAHIDDILVYAETEEQHEKNFRIVQRRLYEYDLEENMSKEYIVRMMLNF